MSTNLLKTHRNPPKPHKLRGRGGMSIAETLVALLIISLLTMGIATGVAFGAKQYKDAVTRSEASILCSTLTSAISDKLRNATEESSGKLTAPNGRVLYDGNDLIPAAAYSTTMELKADADAAYVSGIYTVRLKIYTDSLSNPLMETTFNVIPLNRYD